MWTLAARCTSSATVHELRCTVHELHQLQHSSSMRAWRPIVGPAGERCYYFSLRCGTNTASVRITDLCDWWSCDLDLQALEDQKSSYEIQTPLDKLLQTFADCFEETAASDAYRFELASAEPGHSRLLCLELTDSMRMEFRCARAAETERAIRVRDEFMLPALLTLEQLDRSAPESAAWEPPSGAAATPGFQRPSCQQIFSWALAQVGSVLGAPGAASAAADAVAASAPEPSMATASVAPSTTAPIDARAEERRAVREQRNAKAEAAEAKRSKTV